MIKGGVMIDDEEFWEELVKILSEMKGSSKGWAVEIVNTDPVLKESIDALRKEWSKVTCDHDFKPCFSSVKCVKCDQERND